MKYRDSLEALTGVVGDESKKKENDDNGDGNNASDYLAELSVEAKQPMAIRKLPISRRMA